MSSVLRLNQIKVYEQIESLFTIASKSEMTDTGLFRCNFADFRTWEMNRGGFNPHQKNDMFKEVVRMLIRNNRYSNAREMLEHQKFQEYMLNGPALLDELHAQHLAMVKKSLPDQNAKDFLQQYMTTWTETKSDTIPPLVHDLMREFIL